MVVVPAAILLERPLVLRFDVMQVAKYVREVVLQRVRVERLASPRRLERLNDMAVVAQVKQDGVDWDYLKDVLTTAKDEEGLH